jgi:hypothetical protein
MSLFQDYFSFFTLIIGLAVAAVARGFGTLWQTRRRARVGYLTPLLAAFLLLDMSRFWLALWTHQQISSLGALALASVLCVTLPYVFVTTIMFPADPSELESLDQYYVAHARPIFLSLLASKIAAYGFDALLFGWKPSAGDLPGVVLILVPFAVLTFARSITVHYIGLTLLVVWSVAVLALVS